MNQPSQQRELTLTNQTENQELPEKVIAQCRELLVQMLREVLQAEKEVNHEQ